MLSSYADFFYMLARGVNPHFNSPLPLTMIITIEGGCLGFQLFVLQDSDWEEIPGEDMESDKDLFSSAAATPFGRSAYDHLEEMAKTYNEVWVNRNNDEFSGLF